MSRFRASLHPRGARGRFVSKGGRTGGRRKLSPKTKKRLKTTAKVAAIAYGGSLVIAGGLGAAGKYSSGRSRPYDPWDF